LRTWLPTDDQFEEDTMTTLLGGPGRMGDSADQDLDREHPPDRRPRSCTHHGRRGLGLAKEPRASTNRGGSSVSSESGC